MTVAQLIEKLQNYDPTLLVYVGGDYYFDEGDSEDLDGSLDYILISKDRLYLQSNNIR